MFKSRSIIALIAMQAIAACSLLEPKPAPPPAPAPAPPAAPAPAFVDDLPYPPLPAQTAPKPETRPRMTTPAKPKTAHADADRKGVAGASTPVPDANTPTGIEASAPAATARTARKSKRTPVTNEPEWLKYCSKLQRSSTGVLCDANTLLAQPSAKVRVYVREPALVRDTPGGRIVLRDGLPKLYRLFVLP